MEKKINKPMVFTKPDLPGIEVKIHPIKPGVVNIIFTTAEGKQAAFTWKMYQTA